MSPTKPYLESLDRSAGRIDVTVEWARFLGETFGATGALNCLRYYEDLGWISPRVRTQMVSYLRGLSLGEIHNKRYDEPTTLESLSGTLFSAHARSLAYIARICDDDLEEHVMIARMADRRVDRRTEAAAGDSTDRVSVIRDGPSQSG
ncbi:FlaD/FlaE family flagellar protein [Natrialbaceae archaeon GCM10025810]|uniref:FlaD/FlaE family flagellar protein n=1 Tax=Halovalidus salilacus TaxID=3075124 RepID=UPI0036215965